jgi:hypothetical protein
MTIRNRECKVQVHALTRVCTYRGIVGACTCNKSALLYVTNRSQRTRGYKKMRERGQPGEL